MAHQGTYTNATRVIPALDGGQIRNLTSVNITPIFVLLRVDSVMRFLSESLS